MTSMPPTAVDPGAVSRWAAALRASALVGTSRRSAGVLPSGLAPADHASLLDQAWHRLAPEDLILPEKVAA